VISVSGTRMLEPWDSHGILIREYVFKLVLICLSFVLFRYATQQR